MSCTYVLACLNVGSMAVAGGTLDRCNLFIADAKAKIYDVQKGDTYIGAGLTERWSASGRP